MLRLMLIITLAYDNGGSHFEIIEFGSLNIKICLLGPYLKLQSSTDTQFQVSNWLITIMFSPAFLSKMHREPNPPAKHFTQSQIHKV